MSRMSYACSSYAVLICMVDHQQAFCKPANTTQVTFMSLLRKYACHGIAGLADGQLSTSVTAVTSCPLHCRCDKARGGSAGGGPGAGHRALLCGPETGLPGLHLTGAAGRCCMRHQPRGTPVTESAAVVPTAITRQPRQEAFMVKFTAHKVHALHTL